MTPETFIVIFAMYRNVYEDEGLRNDIAKSTWLRALEEFGGTPAENSRIQIAEVVKFLGPLPVPGDDYFWDSARVKVEGQAYRTRTPDRVTQVSTMPLDDALDALAHTLRQYVADSYAVNPYHYCTCPQCALVPDEDDLDTSIPSRTYDPQYEDDGYPWTDSATWYPEYAEED